MLISRSVISTARSLASVVFPEVCLGCGAPARGNLPVCASCLRRLPPASTEAVRAELADRGADAALLTRAAALWTFDAGGTVQRVQHALKYRGRPRLGVPLGHLLAQAVTEAVPGWMPEIVAPVPLARVRELERGYNQAEGLAEGAADALGAAFAPTLVRRIRPTRSQTRLSNEQRWKNVDGAFALAEGARVTGRRVLLVDDVLTTGATLLAATQPLADAGAEVGVAALAFAP
ncbi:MAG: phosphoribosyltransferase family protein [Bacteroidota bacterium]